LRDQVKARVLHIATGTYGRVLCQQVDGPNILTHVEWDDTGERTWVFSSALRLA
jgi:hypothetical protein